MRCNKEDRKIIYSEITSSRTRRSGELNDDMSYKKLERSITRRTPSFRRQTVDGVIGLALGANLTTKREIGACGERTAVLVDIGDCELDGSMVLGYDKAV
jgi:hypothetical protein